MKSNVVVTLPDGSKREYPVGVSGMQIAESIGPRLAKDAIAIRVDGKVWDLFFRIQDDSKVEILTRKARESLDVIRHSTAHLLAQAVKELFPETQVTIGPVTEDGFYYDFSREEKFTPDDLPVIEKKMREIANKHLEVSRQEWTKEQAIPIFEKMGEHFKVQIIKDIPDSVISTYQQGDFVDLCRGPHITNTAKLGKFKLLSIAGAYWRGDEKNEMLQRIYGTAFATQEELDEHLHLLEEARKRDHRKLGPEMGLFTFLPVAPAMPFYLPKGTTLYNSILGFMRKQMTERGYEEVICPQAMNISLWKTSGHWDHFRENMFFLDDNAENASMALKPMNCPGHVTLFGSKKHSYRELPIRYAEFSRLHRNERAGATHGIFRVRAFSQDDAHIFCTFDQIESEAQAVIKHTYEVYKAFGFEEVDVKLATRDPKNFMGEVSQWDIATEALATSLRNAGKPFEIAEGEGAFYGPKIEFHIKDSLKRSWQCGTIQVDFNMPARFGVDYTDTDGTSKTPLMLHRAILGSLERFMGILVEHHAGHLPLWVAPVQATVINVSPDQEAYAKQVTETLKQWGVRVELDDRNEKLGYRIREAQLQKIPLMLILGQKEVAESTISVRRSNGETLNDLSLTKFEEFLKPKLIPGGVSH